MSVADNLRMIAEVSAPAGAIELSYVGRVSDLVDRNIYTFSDAAIGAATGDREIVVGVLGIGNNRVLNAVAIGGVTATLHRNFTSSGNRLAICSANVPTGTTGDIVVTFNGAVAACSVAVFRMVNHTSAVPHDTRLNGTAFVDPLAVNIDVPEDGVVVSAAWGFSWNAEVTWAGVNEDHDLNLDFNRRDTAAHIGPLAAETGRTVSISHGFFVSKALIAASWS